MGAASQRPRRLFIGPSSPPLRCSTPSPACAPNLASLPPGVGVASPEEEGEAGSSKLGAWP